MSQHASSPCPAWDKFLLDTLGTPEKVRKVQKYLAAVLIRPALPAPNVSKETKGDPA